MFTDARADRDVFVGGSHPSRQARAAPAPPADPTAAVEDRHWRSVCRDGRRHNLLQHVKEA
jgi:hypothetical protein